MSDASPDETAVTPTAPITADGGIPPKAVAPTTPTTPVSISGKCYVGGCSAQICSEDQGAVSNCMYSPQYACYKTATCERQASGECGWTETAELQACLKENVSTGQNPQ